MSYYTYFTLSILEGNADLEVVGKVLSNIMGLPDGDFLFSTNGDTLISNDSMKWYDHDEECAGMSKQFPGVVFLLHGEGEEAGDMWDAYYKEGKCQICRVQLTYAKYDPTKLKSVREAQNEDSGR